MPLTVLAANQAKPKPKPYKLFDGGGQRWLRNFGRDDKWNFRLTTGTLVPANQELQ